MACFGAWVSDIIKTTTSPTYEHLIQLDAIAVIRTFLNYFLSKELNELPELIEKNTVPQGKTENVWEIYCRNLKLRPGRCTGEIFSTILFKYFLQSEYSYILPCPKFIIRILARNRPLVQTDSQVASVCVYSHHLIQRKQVSWPEHLSAHTVKSLIPPIVGWYSQLWYRFTSIAEKRNLFFQGKTGKQVVNPLLHFWFIVSENRRLLLCLCNDQCKKH